MKRGSKSSATKKGKLKAATTVSDEERDSKLKSGSKILIHDTRGQIWMDEREMAQLNLIIEGKVANKSLVEQRTYRYAYLLWEFWKRDTELFPNQIM